MPDPASVTTGSFEQLAHRLNQCQRAPIPFAVAEAMWTTPPILRFSARSDHEAVAIQSSAGDVPVPTCDPNDEVTQHLNNAETPLGVLFRHAADQSLLSEVWSSEADNFLVTRKWTSGGDHALPLVQTRICRIATSTELTTDGNSGALLERYIQEKADLEKSHADHAATLHAVREFQGRYYSLMAHAPGFIMMLSRDGVIETVNRVLPQHTFHQVIGSNVGDFIPDDEDRDSTLQMIRNVYDNGNVEEYISAGEGPDGAQVYYSGTCAPLREGEETTGVILIATDISERLQLQEELDLRREELSKARRLSILGQMQAMIAHQLSSPIGTLNHFVDGTILRHENGTLSQDELGTTLRKIATTVERLDVIHRNLRQYASSGEAKLAECSINDLIRSLLPLLKHRLDQGKVEVKSIFDDAIPIVPCDPIQISQVIENVIDNAIHALEEVDHKQRLISISTSQSEDLVQICIADNGPGLPKDFDLLFEPFQSTRLDGLGVGLAICHRFMDAHGGSITPGPSAEGGAEFTISIPVERASANA